MYQLVSFHSAKCSPGWFLGTYWSTSSFFLRCTFLTTCKGTRCMSIWVVHFSTLMIYLCVYYIIIVSMYSTVKVIRYNRNFQLTSSRERYILLATLWEPRVSNKRVWLYYDAPMMTEAHELKGLTNSSTNSNMSGPKVNYTCVLLQLYMVSV